MRDIFNSIDLIHKGKYQEALIGLKFPYNKILEIRVMELNGYFNSGKEIYCDLITQNLGNLEKAHTYISGAYIYWRLNNFDKGQKILILANDHIKGYTRYTKYLRALSLNIEGLLYWKEGIDLFKALDLFNQSLIIRQKSDQTLESSYSMNNIGNTYLKMGELDLCYKFYQNAYESRKKLGYLPSIAASFNSLGRYFDKIGNYENAYNYHIKCLNLWKQIGNTQFIAKTYRFIARTLNYMGNKSNALIYYNKALNIFNEINNQTDFEITDTIIKNIKK